MSESNGAGTLTTRDVFLRPAARRYKILDLPNGERVRIRSLSELEKSDFEAAILTDRGTANRNRVADTNRRLIVITLVDENGDLLLQPHDVTALESLDGAITSYLAEEIGKHCGFTLGAIEELVKNSERLTAGDSPTGSL